MLNKINLLLAQNRAGNPALDPSVQGLNGSQFLGKFSPLFISILFVFGVLVFFVSFIRGAYAWITAGSDKGKIETAKLTIMHSIAGIVILLSVYGIVDLIENFLGFSFTYFNLTPLNLFK